MTLPHGLRATARTVGTHRVGLRASPDAPVACHNDLLPGNVLFDIDRAWLLDFEYAGMNDRYFDLANLSVNCGLDQEADDEDCSSRTTGRPRHATGRDWN